MTKKLTIWNTEIDEPWTVTAEESQDENDQVPQIFESKQEALDELYDFVHASDESVRLGFREPDLDVPEGYTKETAPYTSLRTPEDLKNWITKNPNWKDEIISSVVLEDYELRDGDKTVLSGINFFAEALEFALERKMQS